MPIGERLFIIYFGIGILGAVLNFAWQIGLVIKHNQYGPTLRLIAPYVLRERNSLLVAASLFLFMLCSGYNFVILWPAYFLPQILGLKRPRHKPKQSAYEFLTDTDRHLTLATDVFIWPIAGMIVVLALYLSSYVRLQLPYVTVATVLWIGSIARLASYIVPINSPALEDVPTFLRRRHPSPRRMYLLLLAIEGINLVLLLPLVVLWVPPASVTLSQYKIIVGGFYRPDDWTTLLTKWPPTSQAWITNGSGLLFNGAFFVYVFRCFLSLELVGWEDPFRVKDDDRLYCAESALRVSNFKRAAEHLDQLDARSERSYRLSAQLHLGLGHVHEAAQDAAKHRELLRRSTNRAAVFHELLSYPRRRDRYVERSILRWGLNDDVPDEDLAHALMTLDHNGKGTSAVVYILDALHGEPATAGRSLGAALRDMAIMRPLSAGMILIWGLPDRVDEDLRLHIQAILRRESQSGVPMTPLREGQIAFQIRDHSVGRFESLMGSIGRLIHEGHDQDEIGRVMTYLISNAQYLREQDISVPGATLRERWCGITVEAKKQKRYDFQLHFMMSDFDSELRKMVA